MKSHVYPLEGFYVYFSDVSQDEINVIVDIAGDEHEVVNRGDQRYSVGNFYIESDGDAFVEKVEEEVSKL